MLHHCELYSKALASAVITTKISTLMTTITQCFTMWAAGKLGIGSAAFPVMIEHAELRQLTVVVRQIVR